MIPAQLKQLFFGDNYLEPSKAGEKHEIFSTAWDKALVEALIEPQEPEVKLWQGSASVLMDCLDRWTASEKVWWFHVTNHDSAVGELDWHHEAQRPFNTGLLFHFEINPDDQGGAQQLCLTPDDGRWLVVFDRAAGFEIAFYGPDESWQRLHSLLASRMA